MPHMCNAPRGIRTLASDSLGYVWAGTDNGVYLYDGKKEWITPADLDFFPKTAINKIVFGSDSTIYFATEIGVYVVNGWKNRFLGKGRYLLSERASDVAVKRGSLDGFIPRTCLNSFFVMISFRVSLSAVSARVLIGTILNGSLKYMID